jgi:hypothetical protein
VQSQCRHYQRVCVYQSWAYWYVDRIPRCFSTVLLLRFVFGRAFGKEQDISFNTLSVKDTGRQAQNSMQIALIH